MPDKYELRLTSSRSGTYLFAITPSVDFELMNRIDSAGIKDGTEIVLPIHGFIKGTGPSDTFDQWLVLHNFFINSEVIKAEIILNGNVVYRLDPTSFIGSPYIRDLHTIPQGGSLVNMVEFNMVIVARSGSNKIEGVTQATRSSETFWWNDRLQKKVWRIQATGPNARDILLAMKPPLKPIGVTEIRQVDTNTFTTSFEFDQVHTDQFLRWDEKIEVRGGESPIIPVYRTDGAIPILELGRLREVEVTVTGRRLSLDANVALPTPIFPIKFKDRVRSTRTPVLVDDPIRATFYREYMDVYVFPSLADVQPDANRFKVPVRSKDFPRGIPDSKAPGFESRT